ncbi:MAG: hypothetical protein B7X08_01125 [Acidocella sp. 20-63-7]|nr:MAG: hypothetical protein B7X08_01125 [Acidocella sp. 20-63-7]HQT45843.1 amino acid permease [Acidocella sp.]
MSEAIASEVDAIGKTKNHRRTIGWLGTSALGMGGSNQSVFLLAALFAGQGNIPGQGTAAVPLLLLGLLLSYASAPGWLELVLMYPNRVGGIAASCTAAFRPYSEILSALTGVSYWWGWVPTCGLTALFSAGAIKQWLLPGVNLDVIAVGLVLLFLGVNLCGIRFTTRVALVIATASSSLAFLSAIIPIVSGTTHWHQAFSYHLNTPFEGRFGQLTSLMAGLYLIGFGAPAFEAATCHVGETIAQNRNVPRALLANAAMAGLYFFVLPVVWLGVLGSGPLGGDLSRTLGPVYAPWFGATGRALGLWFITFNMFHGTLQPLAGASRVLSQLSEDGLLPRFLALRLRATDTPWAAATVTAGAAILFLLIGDPIWLVAAANFTYLIGICLPNIAVWLLRRDAPQAHRPWRAPRGTIGLGLGAATVWGLSTVLGFEQFGIPTVVLGIIMGYSGAAFYAWRKFEDGVRRGRVNMFGSLHVKLTGSMLLVLALDATGYIIAVSKILAQRNSTAVMLEDIFVAVAMLTISVGIVLPGMIAHSADQVSRAASHLVGGMLSDFLKAMDALGRGDLESTHVRVNTRPVQVRSRDELGMMARNFNLMQEKIAHAVHGLNGARNGLTTAREQLTSLNQSLSERFERERLLNGELLLAKEDADSGNRAKSEFLAAMSHELRTPMNGVIGMSELLIESCADEEARHFAQSIHFSATELLGILENILAYTRIESDTLTQEENELCLQQLAEEALGAATPEATRKRLTLARQFGPGSNRIFLGDANKIGRILSCLIGNAIKFTEAGRITLGIAITTEDAQDVVVKISVQDTGIGISPEQHGNIFAAFSQADFSTTRKHGGIGLGLAMARRLVEGMGGELGVTSQTGVGSLFWFTLRLRPTGDAPPSTGTADPAAEIAADLREEIGEVAYGQLLTNLQHSIEDGLTLVQNAASAEEIQVAAGLMRVVRFSANSLGFATLAQMLHEIEQGLRERRSVSPEALERLTQAAARYFQPQNPAN